MRASRLLSMLILLQMRGRTSAAALAREFEVSVRTIHRDIDELSGAGVPVYAERGRDGGFELMDGYQTRLTGLTPAEAEAVLLSGLEGPARSLGIGATLEAAQHKMLAALPADRRAGARRIAARFHLDPVAWYRRVDRTDFLAPIARAVWEDRPILIRYESWHDVVERRLSPLGLALKSGLWYLVALAGKEARAYRVSQVRELTVLNETFKRPVNFDLERFWRAWVRDFESRIYRDRAVLRASPAGLRKLRDISAAVEDSVNATQAATTPKGWMRVEIPIETIDHAASELLRIGADVEALSPPALRSRIAASAREVAAIHGANGHGRFRAGQASVRRPS